jgi:ketosteroid isomerase-like protein
MLDRGQIEAVEQQRCEAMIAEDTGALAEMLDDTLIWTHGSARRDTKQSYLSGFGTTGPKYLKIEREDVTIRCFGDTAVVNGVQRMRCIIQGTERQVINSFMNVWCVIDGELRLVAWQSTPVPAS